MNLIFVHGAIGSGKQFIFNNIRNKYPNISPAALGQIAGAEIYGTLENAFSEEVILKAIDDILFLKENEENIVITGFGTAYQIRSVYEKYPDACHIFTRNVDDYSSIPHAIKETIQSYCSFDDEQLEILHSMHLEIKERIILLVEDLGLEWKPWTKEEMEPNGFPKETLLDYYKHLVAIKN